MAEFRTVSYVLHGFLLSYIGECESGNDGHAQAVEGQAGESAPFKKIAPLFAWAFREFHQKRGTFTFPSLNEGDEVFVEWRRMRGSSFDAKRDDLLDQADRVNGHLHLGEAASLFDADQPRILHPLRRCQKGGFDHHLLVSLDGRFLFHFFSAQAQAGAGIGNEPSLCHGFLKDGAQDADFSERSVPVSASPSFFLAGFFVRAPLHVVVASSVADFLRVENALQFEIHGKVCPCVHRPRCGFFVRVVVFDPLWHPIPQHRVSPIARQSGFFGCLGGDPLLNFPQRSRRIDPYARGFIRPCSIRPFQADPVVGRFRLPVKAGHAARCSKTMRHIHPKHPNMNQKQPSFPKPACRWFDPGSGHLLKINELRDSVANKGANALAEGGGW